MSKAKCEVNVDLGSLWAKVESALRERGIDFSMTDDIGATEGQVGPRVKVVCVSPQIKDIVDELSQTTRDQVVMVRVDDRTAKDLDAWVETGAVKSRSEAAALFIREGLKVRATELEALREALHEVQAARTRLRERAKEVLGEGEGRD